MPSLIDLDTLAAAADDLHESAGLANRRDAELVAGLVCALRSNAVEDGSLQQMIVRVAEWPVRERYIVEELNERGQWIPSSPPSSRAGASVVEAQLYIAGKSPESIRTRLVGT